MYIGFITFLVWYYTIKLDFSYLLHMISFILTLILDIFL